MRQSGPDDRSRRGRLVATSARQGLTPAQSACTASAATASLPCRWCTPVSGRSSWSSSPSCGRRASSAHHSLFACLQIVSSSAAGSRRNPPTPRFASHFLASIFFSGLEGTEREIHGSTPGSCCRRRGDSTYDRISACPARTGWPFRLLPGRGCTMSVLSIWCGTARRGRDSLYWVTLCRVCFDSFAQKVLRVSATAPRYQCPFPPRSPRYLQTARTMASRRIETIGRAYSER